MGWRDRESLPLQAITVSSPLPPPSSSSPSSKVAVLREVLIAGGVVGCPLGLANTGIMGGEWEEEELGNEGIALVIREPPPLYISI